MKNQQTRLNWFCEHKQRNRVGPMPRCFPCTWSALRRIRAFLINFWFWIIIQKKNEVKRKKSTKVPVPGKFKYLGYALFRVLRIELIVLLSTLWLNNIFVMKERKKMIKNSTCAKHTSFAYGWSRIERERQGVGNILCERDGGRERGLQIFRGFGWKINLKCSNHRHHYYYCLSLVLFPRSNLCAKKLYLSRVANEMGIQTTK